jgi:hypothetical protein
VTFTLTVNGTNFDANAIIVLAGVDMMGTNRLSTTQLTVSIPAASIPVAGTYAVTVRNADNSVSNSVTLTTT